MAFQKKMYSLFVFMILAISMIPLSSLMPVYGQLSLSSTSNATTTTGTISATNPTNVPLPSTNTTTGVGGTVGGWTAYANGTIITSVNGVKMTFLLDPHPSQENQRPSAPSGLAAKAVSSSQINLSWTAPSNNGGTPITGYRIQRSLDGSTWQTIVSNTQSTSTTYSDTGLYSNTKYYYRVAAINSVGVGGYSNIAVATTQFSATAPSAPTALTATGGNAQVSLSWTAPPSNGGPAITGYNIYRGMTSGGEAKLTSVPASSTSYTDATVTNGQQYFYKVTAVNSVGESAQSNEASAMPQAPATPPPSNISISSTQSISNTVSASPYQFTISNFNVGTASNRLLLVGISANNQYVRSVTFGGFALKQAVSSFQNNDAEFWYLANPNGTGNVVVTMNGATSAVVGAYAFSGVNQTSPIPATTANYNPPNVASSPSVAIATRYQNDLVADLPSIYGGVTLGSPTCTQTWDTNMPNAITGASSTTVVPSPSTVTCSWTASRGDQWDDVAVEIMAASSTSSPTPTAPAAPTSLTTTGGNAQVSLSWTVPSSNGGSAITGYNIYRGTTSGGEAKLTSVAATQTSYTDNGLTNGQQYFYKVTAVNSVGESAQSNEASATPAASATSPSAPQNLVASGGNSQVSLSWTVPSSNGGSAITGYNIYRGTAMGGESPTPVANVPSTTYTDTGLTNGQAYFYVVKAVNSAGISPASNEAGATPQPPPTAPSAPTGLTATSPSSSQINLSWTVPSSNGGAPITGYKIERSADGTTWSAIASNTGSTATTYSDTGLTASTTYYYRVSAINSAGTSSPSDTAHTTTQNATTSSYSINQVQSGLVASDSLTNETMSQQQLEANPGNYWRYGGDAPALGMAYSYYRDTQGLHIGTQATASGKWGGYFAVSPNTSAELWHALVTEPVRTTPSDYYNNGIYVQTSSPNVNYVNCGAESNTQATIWVVVLTTGSAQQVTTFKTVYVDNSPNQPLTRDCTIITNGSNYVKVFIDGKMVYENSTAALQMPMPFNAYLEPETSTPNFIVSTHTNYYVTAGENVTVNNLPSSTAKVNIVNQTGYILATSTASGGTAILGVGQYHFPLSAAIQVYDSSNTLIASGSESIYGGDVYSVSASSGTMTSSSTTVPSAPTALAATKGNAQVSLSWTTPSSNGGSSITGYNIYRGTTSGGEAKLTSVPASSTSYTDTTVTNGQQYFYQVTAVNTVGESAKSNEASATPQDPATAPAAPTGLSATAVSTSQINLTWTAPSSNGGSAITGYNLYRGTTSDGESATPIATGVTTTSYTDTGLTNGQTYYYTVKAVNSVGTSAASNEATATPKAPSSTTGIVLNTVQSTSGTTSSTNQMTVSSFNAGSGSNQLLMVGVSANNAAVTSVTFGGVQLAKSISSFTNNDAEFWYLKNPSGTGNVVVTFTGATQAVVGAYSFANVDQTTPIPTTATNHNIASSSPSISLATKYANDWVLDLPSIYGGKTLSSPTCTQEWDVNVPSAITGASSSNTISSPSSVTCGWTASNGGDLWDDVAAEIKASG